MTDETRPPLVGRPDVGPRVHFQRSEDIRAALAAVEEAMEAQG